MPTSANQRDGNPKKSKKEREGNVARRVAFLLLLLKIIYAIDLFTFVCKTIDPMLKSDSSGHSLCHTLALQDIFLTSRTRLLGILGLSAIAPLVIAVLLTL